MTNLKFISGTGTTTVIPTNNNSDVENIESFLNLIK